MNKLAPTHETHDVVTIDLPDDTEAAQIDRPYKPPPSLWKDGAKCVHKVTGQECVVGRIDLGTMQFRPFWPETQLWGARTEWLPCSDWRPEVTLSPKELARQAAAVELDTQMTLLDADDLENVTALVDGDDPIKALAKIKALRNMGVIKGAPEVMQAAVAASTAIAEAPPAAPTGATSKRTSR